MLIGRRDVAPKEEAKRKQVAGVRRIHSIAASMSGSRLVGSFEVGSSLYSFSYEPARASVKGGTLHLQGRLRVSDHRRRSRSLSSVEARLLSIQGGIGNPPPRPPGVPARNGAPGAGGQPQLEARASNSDVSGGGSAQQSGGRRFDIDGTGPLAFCGALYFRLQPLKGPALGVRADLSRVQLNARLAPADERERIIHGLYSSIVDALAEAPPNNGLVSDLLKRLNGFLSV
jgi:hypothetical protein